jgi:leucyl aminopeptidase
MVLLFLVTSTLSTTALAMRTIDFAEYRLPGDGAIALPVVEAETLTGVAAAVDEVTGGNLAAALSEASFTGKIGDALTLYGVSPFTRIDLVGVGAETVNRIDAENFGGRLAALNDGSSGTPLNVLWQGLNREPEANAARVALGFLLGDYRFDRYMQEGIDPADRGTVTLLGDDPAAARQFLDDLAHVAASVYLARDLASEPANVLYPQSFVERIEDEFKGLDKVRIKVLDEKELAARGMGAHLGSHRIQGKQ